MYFVVLSVGHVLCELSRVRTSVVAYADRGLLEPLCGDDPVGVRDVMADEIQDLSDVQSGESNVEE